MKSFIITILVLIVVILGGSLIREVSFAPTIDNLNNPNTFNNGEPQISTGAVLNLSGKGLTKAPEYIFNMTGLEELNLSNNNLSGSLQSQIGNLKNLKVLNLSNNKFTGVPAEVGQLNKLEVLNLSNNQLTGLPYELGNLSNLKLLDLSGNNYAAADLEIIKKNLPKSTVIKL